MKVLDLQCRLGHSFEGWFGSQSDYDDQRARGLVTCPVCSDSEITKMLSAPRLNLGHGTAPAQTSPETPAAPHSAASAPAPATAAADSAAETGPSPTVQHMQAAMMQMMKQVIANTEDVGPKFAEEARKIHYGDAEERAIRGQATPQEAESLQEEGIDVLALPVPDHLKGTLQ